MIRAVGTFIYVFFILSAGVYAAEIPQHFEGFDLVGYTDGNKKSWDIKGDTAEIQGNDVALTNITANAYGDENMHLTAKDGTLDKATGHMHLEKDVVITTETGAKLVTDSLDWQRNKDLVTTDDKVVLTKEGMKAVGTGMEGHPNLKTATMKDDVTVVMKTEDKDSAGEGPRTITITCDGPLEVEYEKQIAVFNNNVVAIDADRKLIADKIELFFDSTTKQIKEMICTGHVSIIQGENTTFSDRAVYSAKDQKLTLYGRPKLILFTEGEGMGSVFKEGFANVSSGD